MDAKEDALRRDRRAHEATMAEAGLTGENVDANQRWRARIPAPGKEDCGEHPLRRLSSPRAGRQAARSRRTPMPSCLRSSLATRAHPNTEPQHGQHATVVSQEWPGYERWRRGTGAENASR